MLPFEPEDTSLWDDAFCRYMDELWEDKDAVLKALNNLFDKSESIGDLFWDAQLIDMVNEEIELIAYQQFEDGMREAQESRAIEAAICRQEEQAWY